MSGIDLPVLLDQRPMSRFQWLVVVLCACVLFFDGFDTQAISYAAPMIAREWHLSHAMLGSVFSAALAGLMAGYLLIAPLSDRFGPKRLIVASTALFGVLTLLTILVNATQALIALRFLTGIWLGAAAPGAVTLTSEYSPSACVRRSFSSSIAVFHSALLQPALLPPRFFIPMGGARCL